MHELTMMAIDEGGRVSIHIHPTDERPWGAMIVRKMALAGAEWSPVKAGKGGDGFPPPSWTECSPSETETVIVFLNEADIAELGR